jgi:hypothetical protein
MNVRTGHWLLGTALVTTLALSTVGVRAQQVDNASMRPLWLLPNTAEPPGMTLGAALPQFRSRGGVRLRATGTAAAQPVGLVLIEEDLERAPKVIATHFDYRWRSATDRDGTLQELYSDQLRSQLATKERRAWEDRHADELVRQWDLWIQCLDPGDRGATAQAALAAFQPQRLLAIPAFCGGLAILARIPSPQRHQLANGGRLVSQFYGRLPKEIQEPYDRLFPQVGGLSVTGTDKASGRELLRVGPNSAAKEARRFVLELIGPVKNRTLQCSV